MLLKKVINFLKLSFMYFIGYSIVMYFYTVLLDIPLGKGFKWTCFEPGCVIIDDRSKIAIYGDVEKLALNCQYILGKVGKPNEWMIEHENGFNIGGYFILDKINLTKKLGMSHEEFLQECKKSDISNCRLKYSAPFWMVYDPYYWYIMILDMFE